MNKRVREDMKIGGKRPCDDCGRLYVVGGSKQIRCPGCQHEHRLRQMREYTAAHKPKKGKGEIVCINCGKKAQRTGWRQVRCPECKIKQREAVVAAANERARLRREAAEKRKAETPQSSLAAMNEEARSLGLTYGKYVGLSASGGLEAYLRHRRVIL